MPRNTSESSNPPSKNRRESSPDSRQEGSPSAEERFDREWSPLPEKYRWDTASRHPRQERTTLEERRRRMRSPSSHGSQSATATHYPARAATNPARTSVRVTSPDVNLESRDFDSQPPTNPELNHDDYLDFRSQRSSSQQEAFERHEGARPGGSRESRPRTRQPSSMPRASNSSRLAGAEESRSHLLAPPRRRRREESDSSESRGHHKERKMD